MNYKFHLSIITGAIMIAALVTLVAPHFTGAVGPTADPPDNASLSPTFSGLTVNGETDLNGYTYINSLFYADANKDGKPEFQALDFNIGIFGKYADGAYIAIENVLNTILIKATAGLGIVTINSNELNIESAVDIDGQLTATQVGSYYQIYRKALTSNYTYVSCYAGDFLTSCNGKTVSGSLVYAYPSTNICQVKSTSSAGSIYARAICFDPHGTYSGIINADT